MNITVLGNRVLVEQIRPEDSKIVIPETATTAKGNEFIVRARGDGPDISPKIQPGVKVSVQEMGFQKLYDIDTKTHYRVYSSMDIIAVLG